MTIKSHSFRSGNLFDDNESITFDLNEAHHLCSQPIELAALTFLSKPKEQHYESIAALDFANAIELRTFLNMNNSLKNYRLFLFAADGLWQPNKAMVMHKKLWRKEPFNSYSESFNELSEEVCVKTDRGVRFASIVNIDDENLLDAIELIRKNPSCSLMLSCRKNIKEPDTIQELFGSCFPSAFNSEETCVNYLSLALGVCGYGDIVLRVSGFEDERVAAIDLIYNAAIQI